MTHPLRVAKNCTTHPLRKAQNLMTHPVSAPAHPHLYFLPSPLERHLRATVKNFNEVELRININSEINMTSSDT